MRAGYGYATALSMSPRTLFAISELSGRHGVHLLIRDSLAARAGGATNESFSDFMRSQTEKL